MNRIDRPDFFDDEAALNALAINDLVNSYPELQPYVQTIVDGYQGYVAASGNAFNVPHVPLPEAIEGYLRGHYGAPPADLSFIKEIRSQSGVECCPMCGALHSGTLDHILPKDDYAAFAVFGANLVPACRCNSLRGTTLVGPNPGERILHPYFDNVLGQRLLTAYFDDLGAVPRISLLVRLPEDHPEYRAVRFHVTIVVERNNVMSHLRKSWAKLIRKPSSICVELERNPPSRADLVTILTRQLGSEDDYHGSRNNWRSIFLKGLLDDPVVDWLFARFNAPGRNPNDALLADAI